MKVILVIMYIALLFGGIIFLKPSAILVAIASMILYYVIDVIEDPEE